jgi:hypothetical protein
LKQVEIGCVIELTKQIHDSKSFGYIVIDVARGEGPLQ